MQSKGGEIPIIRGIIRQWNRAALQKVIDLLD